MSLNIGIDSFNNKQNTVIEAYILKMYELFSTVHHLVYPTYILNEGHCGLAAVAVYMTLDIVTPKPEINFVAITKLNNPANITKLGHAYIKFNDKYFDSTGVYSKYECLPWCVARTSGEMARAVICKQSLEQAAAFWVDELDIINDKIEHGLQRETLSRFGSSIKKTISEAAYLQYKKRLVLVEQAIDNQNVNKLPDEQLYTKV